MDSSRAERLRYLLPGIYFALGIALVQFEQIFATEVTTTATSIFILGAGALVLGFFINRVATTPTYRRVMGLNPNEHQHGRVTIEFAIADELASVEISDQASKRISKSAGTIFDEFLNEKCDDKVIGRFFFLNDLESSFLTFSLTSILIVGVGAPSATADVVANGWAAVPTIETISCLANILLVPFFAKGARDYFAASRRYSEVLVYAYLNDIVSHIREYVANVKKAEDLAARLGRGDVAVEEAGLDEE